LDRLEKDIKKEFTSKLIDFKKYVNILAAIVPPE